MKPKLIGTYVMERRLNDFKANKGEIVNSSLIANPLSPIVIDRILYPFDSFFPALFDQD
jgi:hypothetical protein